MKNSVKKIIGGLFIGLVSLISNSTVVAQQVPITFGSQSNGSDDSQSQPVAVTFGGTGSTSGEGSNGGNSGGGGPTPVTPAMTATNAPALVPEVDSSDDILKYGLAQTHFGSRRVMAPSMNYSAAGTFVYTSASGAYAESVIDQLTATNFVYQIANTNDLIVGDTWLYDNSNYENLLFFGEGQYHKSDIGTDAIKYQLYQQETPILELRNVAYSTVLALNPDGSTSPQQYWVRVDNNGHPLWQPWMSGALNGLWTVTFTDGTSVSYRLSSPKKEIAAWVTEKDTGKISGLYQYEPKSGDTNIDMSIVEFYVRPIASVSTPVAITASVNILGIKALDNGFVKIVRPTTFTLWSMDDSTVLGTITFDLRNPHIALPAGTYRIKFSDWQDFASPPMLYTGPSYGKGGVGSDSNQ